MFPQSLRLYDASKRVYSKASNFPRHNPVRHFSIGRLLALVGTALLLQGGVSAQSVPTITSLSPASATAGGVAFTLTVNGALFVSGATVKWNGSALSTTFVSATKLTAAVSASQIAAAGTASVTVTTPTGTSTAATFTINAAQAPMIVSLTPNSGAGQSVAFSAVIADLSGAADVNEVLLLVDTTADANGVGACYVRYDPSSNQLYLRNDAGTGWLLPGNTSVDTLALRGAVTRRRPQNSITVGTVTASNSQCTLNASSSSVSTSGNNLTLSVSLAFSATVVGSQNVYLHASGANGLNSGWIASGSWTPNPPAPTITSLSPASAAAGGTGFTLTVNGP